MMITPRFSVRAAVAAHLGEDAAEIEDYRYQPTRTPCAVYSVGDDYLTATKTNRRPRESDDNFMGQWKWIEIEAQGYAAAVGWHIWRAVKQED